MFSVAYVVICLLLLRVTNATQKVYARADATKFLDAATHNTSISKVASQSVSLAKVEYDRYRKWTDKLKKKDKIPVQKSKVGLTVGFLTFPNSGTSWVQQMLMWLTHNAETTIYQKGEPSFIRPEVTDHGDHVLPIFDANVHQVFIAPTKPSDSIIVKDHGCWKDIGRNPKCAEEDGCHECIQNRIDEYDAVIHLVRNPFDNIHARYHFGCWSRQSSPTCTEAELEQQYGSWPDFLRDDVHGYAFEHCAVSKIERVLPSLTVVYEDLLLDPSTEVNRMLHFMGRTTVPRDFVNQVLEKHKLEPTPDKVVSASQNIAEHQKLFTEDDVKFISSFTEKYVYDYKGNCDELFV